MAQTIVVKLTDDLDGGDADETVGFAIDGRTYEIDLNASNARALRATFQRYIDRGRRAGRSTPSVRPRRSGSRSSNTLFSQLDSGQKDRFRSWASMPDARRISDARVQAWIDAGRP